MQSINWDTKKRLGHPETDEAVIASLKEAKDPRDQTELNSFLVLCHVYRRFVFNYSHVAAPLDIILCQDQSFIIYPLTSDHGQYFEALV